MTSVRVEEPGDVDAIRETNALAFGSPLEASLVDALRGSEDYLSLVAVIDGKVVGHILFTPVTSGAAGRCPHRRPGADGRAPRTSAPGNRRSTDTRRASTNAARRGYSAVVVLGHPEYYPQFGFVPGHTFGLTCEFPSPPEAFMAIELVPGAFVSGTTGVVRYRSEFICMKDDVDRPETDADVIDLLDRFAEAWNRHASRLRLDVHDDG